MTLRSIDAQVMLPKIPEVNRNQPVQEQQSQTMQQQFAAQLQKQTDTQRQQVQNSKKSEGSLVERDSKKKHSGQNQSGHRDEAAEGDQADKVRDPARGNLLDIKI